MSAWQAVSVAGGRSAPYLSTAVRAGDFLFVSGHAGFPPGPSVDSGPESPVEVPGDIEEQTRQTLENIKAALEAAGASLSDVVKVNTYLRNPDRDFWPYNRVYMQYFPDRPPARTSVGVVILAGILIEIECVAYLPAAR